jgi:hypothetical protein
MADGADFLKWHRQLIGLKEFLCVENFVKYKANFQCNLEARHQLQL